jgi:hypothetical protein
MSPAARTSRRAFASLLAAIALASCYSSPSVSEPPTLDRIVLRLPKGAFTTESPLVQTEIPLRYDTQSSYSFYLDVTGKAGRFENGNPEAEQWVFRSIDYSLTVGGQPKQVEWVADGDRYVMRTSFDLEGTDKGKKVELRATVADALGRKSNEITYSGTLVSYTIDPRGNRVDVP